MVEDFEEEISIEEYKATGKELTPDELVSHIESVVFIMHYYKGAEYVLIRDPNIHNYDSTYTIKHMTNPNLVYFYDNSIDAINHFIELEFKE